MKNKLIPLLGLVILLLTRCQSEPKQQEKTDTTSSQSNLISQQNSPTPGIDNTEDEDKQQDRTLEEKDYYADGNYCADVRYTNPNTGTQSIYSLNVVIKDGDLIRISWPNGGWLDNSHFTPPHINESGFTTFTSDAGYEFDVLIKSSGGCNYQTLNYRNESKNDEEKEEDEETKLEKEYGRYKAEVYKKIPGCDYMILEWDGDYYVAEWMGSYDPDEGDRIQGELHSFGTKTCYVPRRDRETRLYIEDYSISLSRAWEIIRDKCD